MTITELYLSKRAALFVFANKVIKHEEDAQDIVQNAFVYMVEHKSEAPEFLVWELVKNRCINYLRDKKDTTNDIPEDPEPEIEVTIIRAQAIAILYKHIDELPPQKRKVMQLFIKGYSLLEIAHDMDISYKTARNQKVLGLAILRKLLNPEA